MSRFLLLSEDGSGTGLALRLKIEGHSVKMWTRDPLFKDAGKGFIDNASEYEFGQIVLPECIGFGSLLDLWRDAGIRTFAGSSFADRVEEDRELADSIMKECDIDTPESKRATSWEEASKLCEKLSKLSDDGKVVIKPEGKLSGIVPSYVASSVEDALSMLESYEQQTGGAEPELVIQQFIAGIAVSTEGWFDGENWIEGMFNRTIENKKTLNSDLGPSEGCAGNVVWAVSSKDPIVKQTLFKLTEVLRKARYVGPFDINCVINEKGLYALEFTPRFGYDAFPTLLHTLCDFNFGSFIDQCSSGSPCEQTLGKGFGAGIRLTLPHDEDHSTTTQVRGIEEEDLQCFYPYHVSFSDAKGIESIRGGSMVGVVTGLGSTIGEAFARAYLVATKAQIRDVQFRTDLCETSLKDFRELSCILSGDEDQSWIGVDLDGTLAEYSGWSDEIGKPIPRMIQRVKGWIDSGKDVRILTARGSCDPNRYEQLVKVYDWVKEHIGTPLEVTSKKDPLMKKLYDDRVQRVEANTGAFI